MLSTHEAWIDFRRGTISALCRWRRQHTFLPNPAISWKVAFDFFRHTVGTAHSDVLEEAGQRRPMRPFRFLYQRLASAALHRWETYLERRVQAKGWDGPMLRRAPLPRSVPQSHRWFLLKPHLNAPIASARLQRESLMKPQCCFCSSHSDSLDHLPRCFKVLDVFDSIPVAANLPPISDGRFSPMLQERWEGSVVASIVAFFVAIWNVRSMCKRGVRFLSFIECKDLVLVSLQCPWLVRCCPTRSNEQRRQDPILPPLPTPGVTIYKSDGACRGQGTNAETHASWSAAVWSADDRGLGAGVAFATARGFLGKDYSNNQAEYIAPLQCLCRALRLQDPHVIFEVDSLLLAKQLARHLPWACRSENLIALHQQCVHVCDSLSALHISWIFGIFIVSSNRAQTHCLIKRLMSVIRVVLRLFGNAQTAHPAYLFFSLLHPFCYSRVSDLV